MGPVFFTEEEKRTEFVIFFIMKLKLSD